MRGYGALTGAGIRAAGRDLTTVFFTFAFPLVFLVVFGVIFSGQRVEETGRGYIDYIAPGVLSWGVANAAVFGVAFTLMQWRNDDILRLIRMTPTPLLSVLASRYALAVVMGLLQTLLFVGVALLPFLGLRLAGSWPLLIPLLLLAIVAFLAIGMIVGSVANTPEGVAAVANCVMLPMAFVSGSFFPVDMMPPWLAAISRALPLRYLNDGAAASLAGRGDLTEVAVAAAALGGFSLLFAAVALRVFRWSNDT
ncbi:ABC transporter permease [Actinokineospora auranticolor]|uniref:Transport permease protein n=1 Tax=Actinokineospora auranticolor TaxID=155976 RepID=A0A2S6GEV6_9PSEU|nr:ABC transporter permease [Actinokineospora auranticolor]PPK63730.1 ABC-2 type transport system permease protein [Actinokineospora auranticolor]